MPADIKLTFNAILFDNDGTLLDSTPGVKSAWRLFASEYGFDAEPVIDATHGTRLIDSIAKYCNINDQAKLIAEVTRFEAHVVDVGVTALPGALDLIRQVNEGAPTDRPGWTIVTSATRGYALSCLAKHNVPISPEALVTSSDVAHGKPHPEPYLKGASICKATDLANVLVVEDAVSGITSARAGGMKSLGTCTTTPRETLLAAGADWIVPDLTHVSALWANGKLEITIRGESSGLPTA